MYAQSLQSCLIRCDAMDFRLPGSFVNGILQARILEWVAMPSSRGSSQPRDQTRSPTLQVDSLLTEPPGKFSLLLIFFIKQMFKMAWDMLEIC